MEFDFAPLGRSSAQHLWDSANNTGDGWGAGKHPFKLTTTIREGSVRLQWGAKDYRAPAAGHILMSDFVRTDTPGLMGYQPVKGYESRPRYATTLVVWEEQVKLGSEYFGRLYGKEHTPRI